MSYRNKTTLNVLTAKSSTAVAQSLGQPTSSAALAQPAEPASSLKAPESLLQQQPPVLGLTSSGVLWPPTQPLWLPTGVLQPPTQPLRPPTVVAGASAEAPGCSRQILPPPGTEAGASKLFAQQGPVGLSRSIKASKPLPQQLIRPTPSSEASQLPSQPSIKKSVQHATSTRASIEVPL